MEVENNRFSIELVKVIQLIADSHFVALDLEFSGIAGRRQDQKKLTLQQMYQDTKEAAERYQVLQVGLTVVQEDLATGKYIARPYNFNINPIPATEKLHLERIWSFQSGAVDFLLRNGFSFDLPYTSGIPYLSRQDEQRIQAAWALRDKQKTAIPEMPTKEEDMSLIKHVHQAFERWQAQATEVRDNFLNIPDISDGIVTNTAVPERLNRYQIRLVHQIVRSEYMNFKTAGKGHFIQITPSETKRKLEEKVQQARYRERDISQSIEFRWLIEALSGGDITRIPTEYFRAAFPSDGRPEKGEGGQLKIFVDELQEKLKGRRRILFGHNCFTDLVYLYKCFIGDLPEQLEIFLDLIREMFPAIVDTKHMASFGRGWHSSSLQDVEMELRDTVMPKIEVPIGFDRYTNGQKLHEAGFDSLLTAQIAIKLSAKLEKEGKYPHETESASQLKYFGSPLLAVLEREDDEQSEHYTTATESIADNQSIVSNIASTVKDALSTPVTAIHNMFRGSDFASAGAQFEAKTESSTLQAESIKNRPSRLATMISESKFTAVGGKPLNWSKSAELERFKAALAPGRNDDLMTASPEAMYDQKPETKDILGEALVDSFGDADDSNQLNDDQVSDLMVWSDKAQEEQEEEETDAEDVKGKSEESEEVTKNRLTEVEISDMVKKGELMPRWNGDLWKFFGKKLQVNSSVEGICHL